MDDMPLSLKQLLEVILVNNTITLWRIHENPNLLVSIRFGDSNSDKYHASLANTEVVNEQQNAKTELNGLRLVKDAGYIMWSDKVTPVNKTTQSVQTDIANCEHVSVKGSVKQTRYKHIHVTTEMFDKHVQNKDAKSYDTQSQTEHLGSEKSCRAENINT